MSVVYIRRIAVGAVVALALLALVGCGDGTSTFGLTRSNSTILPPPGPGDFPILPINQPGGPGTLIVDTARTELIAGWGNSLNPMRQVGWVTTSMVGTVLSVTFTTDVDGVASGWLLNDAHVAVVWDYEDFGTKLVPNDALIPDTVEIGLDGRTIRLTYGPAKYPPAPPSNPPKRTLFIGAHAAVSIGVEDYQAVEHLLPSGLVQISLTNVGPAHFGVESYFGVSVDDLLIDAGQFDGVNLRGWCVDPSRPAVMDLSQAYLISSYDTSRPELLRNLVGNSDNLDVVNYIVNTDWAAKIANASPALSFAHPVGYLEIQAAIWKVIDIDESDDEIAQAGLVNVDRAMVDWIAAHALAQGDGFRPTSAQNLVVIADVNQFVPDGDNQIVIIEYPAERDVEVGESAWGYGYRLSEVDLASESLPSIPPSGRGQWQMFYSFVVQP